MIHLIFFSIIIAQIKPMLVLLLNTGITAVTSTYPLDVIRSRLAFQYKGEHIYGGIMDCIRKIYAVRGLYSF
jgi:hypothetical protein